MSAETNALVQRIQKRKAKRKPRRKDDFLWKAIFEDISEDFLRFFFPDADALFDMEKKCEYLDKEFDPFFPQEEDGVGGVRYVDKLVKVFLKGGGEKWISIHIEVQNQRGKEDFSTRMLRYWYLMKDRYNVSITALAILTSSNKNFRPKPYVEEYLGTRLTYEYNVYKIMDQDEAELKANPNPFAVVILVALSAIKQKKVNDQDLKAIKHDLNLELVRRNVDGAKHKAIMNFMKYYVNFENPNMMITFDKEIEQLLGRTTPMGTEEYLLQKREAEGIQIGEAKGIEKGIAKGISKGRHDEALDIAREMLAENEPFEKIIKYTKLSIEEIQSL